MSRKIGGMSEMRTNMPPEVVKLVEDNKNMICENVADKSEFEHFEIIGYATQVVAGVNYFFRIKITNQENESENEYIHVRLFHGLDRNVQIVKVLKKKHDDLLEYF